MPEGESPLETSPKTHETPFDQESLGKGEIPSPAGIKPEARGEKRTNYEKTYEEMVDSVVSDMLPEIERTVERIKRGELPMPEGRPQQTFESASATDDWLMQEVAKQMGVKLPVEGRGLKRRA